MSQKSIILIIVLFVLIIVGMFTFAYLKKSELQQELVLADADVMDDAPYSNIARIDAKHYFVDGTHTLVGEVILPTACDLLTTEAVVMESFPEQVQINFTVINTADDCTAALTQQRFSVAVAASAGAAFAATFMDRPVELNLIPAADGELPEEFELFIKG